MKSLVSDLVGLTYHVGIGMHMEEVSTYVKYTYIIYIYIYIYTHANTIDICAHLYDVHACGIHIYIYIHLCVKTHVLSVAHNARL